MNIPELNKLPKNNSMNHCDTFDNQTSMHVVTWCTLLVVNAVLVLNICPLRQVTAKDSRHSSKIIHADEKNARII